MAPLGLLLLVGLLRSNTANALSVEVPQVLRLLVSAGLPEWTPDNSNTDNVSNTGYPVSSLLLSTMMACANRPCDNNGTCIPKHLGLGFTCSCTILYTGATCAQRISERRADQTPSLPSRHPEPAHHHPNTVVRGSGDETSPASGDGDGKRQPVHRHRPADHQTNDSPPSQPSRGNSSNQPPPTVPGSRQQSATSNQATLPTVSFPNTRNLTGSLGTPPPDIAFDSVDRSAKRSKSAIGVAQALAVGLGVLALLTILIASLLVTRHRKRSRMAARPGRPSLNNPLPTDKTVHDSLVQLDAESLTPEHVFCAALVHEDDGNVVETLGQNFTSSLAGLLTQSRDDTISRAMAYIRENDLLFAGPRFVDVVNSDNMTVGEYTDLEYCGSRIKLLRAPDMESFFHDSCFTVAMVTNNDLAPYTPNQSAPIVAVHNLCTSKMPEIVLTHPLYSRERPATSSSSASGLVLLEYTPARDEWTATERVLSSRVTDDGWECETAIRKPGMYTLAQVGDYGADVIGCVIPSVRAAAGGAAASGASADQSVTTEAEEETTAPAPTHSRPHMQQRRVGGGNGGPGDDEDDPNKERDEGGLVGEPQFKWPCEAVLTLHARMYRDDPDQALLLYRITLLRGQYKPDHYQLRILNAELAHRSYSTEHNRARICNLSRDDVIEVKLSPSRSSPEVHIPDGIQSGDLIPASDLHTATPLDYDVMLGLSSEPQSQTISFEVSVVKIVNSARYKVPIFPLVRFPLPPLTQDAQCPCLPHVVSAAEARPTVIAVPSTDDRDSAMSIAIHDNLHTCVSVSSSGLCRSSAGSAVHITSSPAPQSVAECSDAQNDVSTTPLPTEELCALGQCGQLSISRIRRPPALLPAVVAPLLSDVPDPPPREPRCEVVGRAHSEIAQCSDDVGAACTQQQPAGGAVQIGNHLCEGTAPIERVSREPADSDRNSRATKGPVQVQPATGVHMAATSCQRGSGTPSRASSGYLSGETDVDNTAADGMQSVICQTFLQVPEGSQSPDSALETAV